MSLVGSLEDLDLGDILQIIHLSRKSGALQLQSSAGAGQIVFCDGLIATAFCKGGPTDLRELLLSGSRVEEDALSAAVDHARARGHTLEETLLERGLMDAEAIDLARRGHAEEAVLRMFGWRAGEFSFEVREIRAGDVGELFIEPGLNPQFLALEGTRQFDESEHEEMEVVFDGESETPYESAGGAEPEAAGGMSAGDPFAQVSPGADPFAAAAEAGSDAVAQPEEAEAEPMVEVLEDSDAELASNAELVAAPAEVAAEVAADSAQVAVVAHGADTEPVAGAGPVESAAGSALEVGPAGASGRPSQAEPARPIIVIDPSLPVLEWVKQALESREAPIHVFQTSELGISRIRQYLARRALPLVLIAADAPADTLSGARDSEEIVRRLRAQAPRMRVEVLSDQQSEDGAIIRKPTPTELADPRAVERRMELAAALREELDEAPPPGADAPAVVAGDEESVSELRAFSARIRDPESRGEVLGEVLRFASRSFSRVALFMVREGQAVGLAQHGLSEAGGPDDGAFRGVVLAIESSPRLSSVIETRAAQRAGPSEADAHLAGALGGDPSGPAFLAPIESSGTVVAVVYGDVQPGDRSLPNTGTLEVALHQAGLALDRAALERVLHEG